MGERVWFLRKPIQFFADVAVLCAAFFIAYLPSINIQLDDFFFDIAIAQVSFVIFVQISTLFLLGAYSIIWRYISISDLRVFLYAAFVSGGILLALRLLLPFTAFSLWQIPISVILIDTFLAFGGLLALRVLRRILYEFSDGSRGFGVRRPIKRKRTLLIGAGRTGATLAREISGRADAELDIYGFIDDDPRSKGGRVSGFKVLGPTDELARFVEEIDVEQVVITLDHAHGKEVRRIVDLCSEIGVKARIVPSLNEIAAGKVSTTRLRDVEIDDLLGREPVCLETENLAALIAGKTVMVTGAGGSIGAELVRQISNFGPGRILLVERAEYALFEIAREFESKESAEVVPLIADVCDEARMRQIFERYRPEIVFHAAAHKHVSLMESNAVESVKNNTFATQLLGSLAGEFGATDFVFISTDKAVNPTSVMGASKRLAEIAVQDLNRRFETHFIAVRFGNVLGSAGSVVPIFRDQIRAGGPVTVTDPEMTRYFMTIPEACQLVMQAGALGTGGEIFILDMGQPIRILDLAKDMIRLSGYVPFEDIDIVFSGIRKGEKLFEELEMTGENMTKTRHPKIFIGNIAAFSAEDVEQMFSVFRRAVTEDDEAMLRTLFNRFLSEAKVVTDDDGTPPTPETKNEKYFSRSGSLRFAEK